MKHLLTRGLALLTTAALLLMTACGNTAAHSQSGDTPDLQVAMGRYIEEEEPGFPKDFENISAIKRLSDGSIRALISKTPDRIKGPWYLYNTADEGKTWVQLDAPWLTELAEATITAADFTPDGGLALAYVIYTEEMEKAMAEAIAAQDFEVALDLQPSYQYVTVTPEGAVTPFSIELPKDSSGREGSPADLHMTEAGDLVVNDYYTLYQFDSITGKVKNKYQPSLQPRVFLPCGQQLAIIDSGELQLYDLETGERAETVALPTGDNGGCLAWDGEAVYYCGSTGIYRRTAGGGVMERVIDGELTSLGMPALNCSAIFPARDKSFLALYSGDDGYSTLRYSYSETMPTLPGKQLRVYSLRDNKNIRQAMGLYQRNHPDTQVIFDVGLTDETMPVSDALRTLSTQLLAGQGPDILVLDGMPVDSYIEKGVLAELGELTGDLLPNIVEASRETDGKLYALPARFLVPLAVADSAAADSMKNLSDLADYQSKRLLEMPDANDNPMQPTPSMLINTFYPVCAPAWDKGDGTLDTQAISEFLADIKKITDTVPLELLKTMPVTSGVSGNQYDFAFSAAYWLFGNIPMAYGHTDEFFSIAPAEEAISQKGDGKVFLLPGQASGVFIPQTMLGINAASGNIDAAKELLGLVLSQSVQACGFSGYPVNVAAFDRSAQNPFTPTDDGYTYGTQESDGSYNYLQVIWPDDAYMEQMKSMIRGLTTASRVDVIALQMVLDETQGYYLGEKSLEDTVAALGEKLRLYSAE